MPAFFAILLGILFIAFKLAGIVAWSWLWVLAPFWIFFLGLIVFFLLAMLGVGLFAAVFGSVK